MKIRKRLLLLMIITSSFNCNEADEIGLELKSSPNQVELFGPNTISTTLYERDIAIAPNGQELIYTLGDHKQARRCLVQMKMTSEKWTDPEILNISGEHQDIEPFFSPDGKGLFFASNRPISESSERKDYNIWYSERDGDQWAAPEVLGEHINTEKDEFYPSVSNNGNLYFTAVRENGIGTEDIFVSRKVDGAYTEAVVLDSTVNTKYYEFNAFVSPDEDLLIFSSFGRSDGLGSGDLYYSQRNDDGSWSQSKNFGPVVNSDKLDFCPFVDFNRNNFYFTSERVKKGAGRLKDVEELINYSNSPKNGFGNIYRIGIKQLNLDLE